MSSEHPSCPLDRRHFLQRIVPLGCLSCLGASAMFRDSSLASQDVPAPHKFKEDSQYSFEELFRFAFAENLVRHLGGVGDQIGRDRLIEILKTATEDRVRRVAKRAAQEPGKHDFKTYNDWARNPDRYWKHVLTFDIIEDTSSAFEVKVTECLWAKTFREANAADIGYAVICHADFAFAEGYSTHLRLVRSKTLMEGCDRCNHRYLWQT
jgi:hypothetical protein